MATPHWYPSDVWRADWNPNEVDGSNVFLSSDVHAGAIALFAWTKAQTELTDGGSDLIHACSDAGHQDASPSDLVNFGQAVYDYAVGICGEYMDAVESGIDAWLSAYGDYIDASVRDAAVALLDGLGTRNKAQMLTDQIGNDDWKEFVEPVLSEFAVAPEISFPDDFIFTTFFPTVFHTMPCKKNKVIPSPEPKRPWL